MGISHSWAMPLRTMSLVFRYLASQSGTVAFRLGCLRNFVSSKFRIFRMFFIISYTIRKWQQVRENNRNWRLILGPWRLILGPCRLTMEPCMLTLKSLHAQPGFMEAHPRPVEVYLGAVEPHSGALEA